MAFAPSLLTITAGRVLFASAPRTGSNSTSRTSPRRIQPVRGGLVPRSALPSSAAHSAQAAA